MALTVKHAYQSATADDPSREISSSEWNAAMTVTGTLDPANGGTGTTTGISSATQTALDGKVNDTGDTLTGDLVISKTSAALRLNRTDYSGVGIESQSSGAPRWVLYMARDAETGGNTGSNFALYRCNDAGAFIDVPFSISRATGAVTVFGDLYIGDGPF